MGFQPGRENQPFSQMRGVFINRETGAVGRQLKQYPTGFFEIDRLEPEAIDHRRRAGARAFHARADCKLMVVVVDAPGEMVDRSHAPGTTTGFGSVANVDNTRTRRALVPRPTVFFRNSLESEHGRQELSGRSGITFPQLSAMETPNLSFSRNGTFLPCGERAWTDAFDERDAQSMRVAEREDLLAEARFGWTHARPIALESFVPIGQTIGGYFESNFHRHPMTCSRWGHVRPWKKGEIRARTPFRVGIEQMISARVVLVDASFDQPHPENAGVEVQILLGGPRNRRDVMQSVDPAHGTIIAPADAGDRIVWPIVVVTTLSDLTACDVANCTGPTASRRQKPTLLSGFQPQDTKASGD